MTHKPEKFLRCAIYTRKSTEHGLELEFNSLDAQRDSCEAYIKSQTHEGWRTLPQHYDDPAYSGGNLDRPALQTLLKDIDADKIDVVVVYKIDRLTRSLADFAKLVELFDKKKISFVAVTQQFNTTTSMGRLTLNVLLSFAQFERELSSERVRDKVAASRRKGKWTGGGLPLGYDAVDKKLVINEVEAKAVRCIYRTYLELKCLRRVATNLREQQIFTKYRAGLSGRKAGGISFNHGPLAYLLKNRTYVGEIGHDGKWYPGEHEAIIDRTLFDDVQNLLKENSVIRRKQRSDNQSLLSGLLYDDCGSRMSPTYSIKGEVRYRFYVSTALLSGGTNKAGTLPRVSAPDLETKVVTALRDHFPGLLLNTSERQLIDSTVERVELSKSTIRISLKQASSKGGEADRLIEVACSHPNTDARARAEVNFDNSPNLELVQAISSGHMYMKWLSEGRYQSIEKLAAYVKLHPKVVRKKLRLAFLAPDITDAILSGRHRQSLNLADMYKTSPLCWDEQRRLLRFTDAA
jgi:DNA invertase Pin-like site-specific DNA recombinase